MKNRLARVRELIQHELSGIIARDHAFPDSLVTINGVDLTPDLKNAHVFVGVIGPEHARRDVIDTLNRERGQLQRRISRRIVLKFTPHLHFKLDSSVERGVRITGIMEQIDRQLEESARLNPDPGSDPDGEAAGDSAAPDAGEHPPAP